MSSSSHDWRQVVKAITRSVARRKRGVLVPGDGPTPSMLREISCYRRTLPSSWGYAAHAADVALYSSRWSVRPLA